MKVFVSWSGELSCKIAELLKKWLPCIIQSVDVFFSPEDLNIIKNGPAGRRKFIDLELSQLDKVYFNHLSNYSRIVNQRNHLLKDSAYRQDAMETLDIWDLQLIQYGNAIIERRKQFVDEMNEIVSGIHKKLTGGKEEIRLIYEPSTKNMSLEQALEMNRQRDIRMKSTSVGPHRDDVCFMVGDLDIRRFGSQGQQRTAALSLKLAGTAISCGSRSGPFRKT